MRIIMPYPLLIGVFLLSVIMAVMVATGGCAHVPPARVDHCADSMVDLYGDLAAESSSGYEDMTGADAHFEGVAWARDYMKMCIEP